jgi:hypothetical protein
MKSNWECSNFDMWSSRTFSIKWDIPNQQNANAFFVANIDDLVGSYLETIECKAFVIIFISFSFTTIINRYVRIS